MASQGKDLGTIAVSIIKALHEVGITRAAGSRAYGQLARGQGVCLSGKGRCLFVADVHPLDGGTTLRVDDGVKGVTDQTINLCHALVFQGRY